MTLYVASAVAMLEGRDALTAWQDAHANTQTLKWEIVEITPVGNPNMTITFPTQTGQRLARARLRRSLVAALAFLLALGFPSHLALSYVLGAH